MPLSAHPVPFQSPNNKFNSALCSHQFHLYSVTLFNISDVSTRNYAGIDVRFSFIDASTHVIEQT